MLHSSCRGPFWIPVKKTSSLTVCGDDSTQIVIGMNQINLEVHRCYRKIQETFSLRKVVPNILNLKS